MRIQPVPDNVKTFTLKDVQKHDNEDDCWIAVEGKVSHKLVKVEHTGIICTLKLTLLSGVGLCEDMS